MLTIRDSQFHIFHERSRRDFIGTRLIPMLIGEYPAAADRLGESGVRKIAEYAFDTAVSSGISSEGGVISIAGLMMQYGLAFERSPDRGWAQRTLADTRLPEAIKLELLISKLAAAAKGRVVVEQDQD